jgi:hypothetical protein
VAAQGQKRGSDTPSDPRRLTTDPCNKVPKCGSPDDIEICALVAVRLTGNGAEIAHSVKDIDGSYWSSENAAGCEACGYQGAVKDFAFSPAGVVWLNE